MRDINNLSWKYFKSNSNITLFFDQSYTHIVYMIKKGGFMTEIIISANKKKLA